ncbi:hypothetical protein DFJ73DRAFT_891902 [Zopfochytrium polystomum]|nr:hypothetical protein DFJ73DRAFT_891902 [Zopfochytrium polystomum]
MKTYFRLRCQTPPTNLPPFPPHTLLLFAFCLKKPETQTASKHVISLQNMISPPPKAHLPTARITRVMPAPEPKKDEEFLLKDDPETERVRRAVAARRRARTVLAIAVVAAVAAVAVVAVLGIALGLKFAPHGGDSGDDNSSAVTNSTTSDPGTGSNEPAPHAAAAVVGVDPQQPVYASYSDVTSACTVGSGSAATAGCSVSTTTTTTSASPSQPSCPPGATTGAGCPPPASSSSSSSAPPPPVLTVASRALSIPSSLSSTETDTPFTSTDTVPVVSGPPPSSSSVVVSSSTSGVVASTVVPPSASGAVVTATNSSILFSGAERTARGPCVAAVVAAALVGVAVWAVTAHVE